MKLRVLNLLAFVAVITMNALANILPINGMNTGQVSALYPSLFTPAGFTFGIWSLIYLLLMIFVVWQLLPGQRTNRLIDQITPWFLFNCLMNCAWIFAWHYELIPLSLILMLGLLFSLVKIMKIIQVDPVITRSERFTTWFTFSIYTGWISVATIANISAVQTDLGLNDLAMNAVSWTLIKLAIAGCVGAWAALRANNIPFLLVVAWAAFGISQKQFETPAVAGAALMLVMAALLIAAVTFSSHRPAQK